MPGLFGFTEKTGKKEEVTLGLRKMSYRKDDILEPIWRDERLFSGQVHLKFSEAYSYHYEPSVVCCWVDGFSLGSKEFNHSYSFAQALSTAYKEGRLEKKLQRENGIFSAVIYDIPRARLLLITDRYGLRPLYFWKDNDHLAWASELKAFLALENFTPEISEMALSCFLEIGYLLGNVTWFEKVELLNAATILEVDLKNITLSSRTRYWSWSMIKSQQISFGDAVEGLGYLLESAVKKSTVFSARVGLSLSGGLDSRAILAAYPNDNLIGLTFGRKEAGDVEIARLVGAIKGIRHHFFYLNSANWLRNRYEGIWKTDGMVNMYHLHASAFHHEIAARIDLEFNGFGGDLVCGGSWVKKLNARISEKTAFEKFGHFFELTSLQDSFFDIESEDCYFIDTRLRRFTNVGSIEFSRLVESRKPFLENELIEFIYSLPDDYRYKGKLYHTSLIQRYPVFFEKVSYQALGYPIGKRPSFPFRLKRKIEREWHTRVLRKRWNPSYVDYAYWFNEEMAVVKSILLGSQVLISEYISRENIIKTLDEHYSNGLDNSEKIGKYLTIEIWLQQVFNRNSNER